MSSDFFEQSSPTEADGQKNACPSALFSRKSRFAQIAGCRFGHPASISKPRAQSRNPLRWRARAGMTQLAQCLCLDLTDAFARDVELLADLLQRPRSAIVQSEAQLDDVFLAGCQGMQFALNDFPQDGLRCGIRRGGRVLVLNGNRRDGCPPLLRWAFPATRGPGAIFIISRTLSELMPSFSPISSAVASRPSSCSI